MPDSPPLQEGLHSVQDGVPRLLANAVLYLALPLSAYVTGQSLGVSGGFHMQ